MACNRQPKCNSYGILYIRVQVIAFRRVYNLINSRCSFTETDFAVPRRLFCFGSLVILDVARCYLWLFTLYINIKIGKNSC